MWCYINKQEAYLPAILTWAEMTARLLDYNFIVKVETGLK
jgi:hypothetical protein